MRFIRLFAVWERSWVKFLQKKGEVANAAAALAKEGTHFLQLLLSSCYYEVIWRIKNTPMSLISIILSYCSWNFYSIYIEKVSKMTFQCISRKSFWMKKGLPYICMGTYIYKCCKPTSGLKVWRFKVCFEFICRSTTEHKYKLLYCFKLRSCSTTQSSNWHTNCNNVCLYSHLEGQLIHMDL